MSESRVVVVGNSSDDPFAIDMAFSLGQREDIADLISLKTFANGEFCPRFISDMEDMTHIGSCLADKRVVIVSTSNLFVSRQNLAMRNFLIARAAKENGAAEVVLVEPDLFFSAQDRGARRDLGDTAHSREVSDLKKFDGQPFTSMLYGQMLKLAGVDRVVTVHNHSDSVQHAFDEIFEGKFHNLVPYDVYTDYLRNSNIVDSDSDGDGIALCAPDAGARDFVTEMHKRLGLSRAKIVYLEKERRGERDVSIEFSDPSVAESVNGMDIVLFDDMVRTGSTVVRSFELLKKCSPRRTIFAVTHFYASEEGRENMASGAIDELLTLNSLPTVLNRDVQGRLRRKMVVLKIERWLGAKLAQILELPETDSAGLYQIDMSSTHPRFLRKIYSNDQLPGHQS